MSTGKVKAVFLDRDGVINIDHGYVHEINNFDFIPGVFEACDRFKKLGYKIFVVTNQAGIARGYYSEAQFSSLSAWMVNEFQLKGVSIEKVYHCPHHPKYSGMCKCRKPEPGMIFTAKSEFQIDLSESIMVGDKVSDIQAAKAAGVGRAFLVRTGHAVSDSDIVQADGVFDDLYEFSNRLSCNY